MDEAEIRRIVREEVRKAIDAELEELDRHMRAMMQSIFDQTGLTAMLEERLRRMRLN